MGLEKMMFVNKFCIKQTIPLNYSTPGFKFLSDLSIIDSLMWIGADNLKQWCKSYN